MTDAAGEVSAILRETDKDRYFATLVLPPPTRAAVTALYAFNAELAAVRDRAKVPQAGEIRLQWWSDALAGEGHGSVRANPVAAALLDAVAEYGLPIPALQRLIDARRFDLYDDPMADLQQFEGYAGETASALLQLAAMILNDGGPLASGDAAGHLGVAQALVGHLRAFGYYASQGRIVLPWSVLAANGVVEAEIFAGTMSEGLAEALHQLAEIAAEHLTKAESAIGALPHGVRPVFAPVALLRTELRRLDLAHPFTRIADLPDWRKIALLSWWRMRRG